jgi:dihydroxyacetone kinase-like predicted kinase
MQKTISGQMLKSMILTAAKLLEVNRATIDALNVFPVPDGDTGTNMSLTFQSAVKELIDCKSNRISDITEAVSKGALRGARGNSGVILSQVLRGFCNTLKQAEEADTKLFSQALVAGAEVAYGAVSKPKEGTMLTVARMVAEHSQSVRGKH